MYIQTDRGTLEAMAWHVGRHVMMVCPGLNEGIRGGHFRVDGQPVADMYRALQTNGTTVVEIDDDYMMVVTVSDIGCTLSVNDAPPIGLDHEAHFELLAVFETAFAQSTKGLKEMREEDERHRYGLPPKKDES
jgi:hypothetical protein